MQNGMTQGVASLHVSMANASAVYDHAQAAWESDLSAAFIQADVTWREADRAANSTLLDDQAAAMTAHVTALDTANQATLTQKQAQLAWIADRQNVNQAATTSLNLARSTYGDAVTLAQNAWGTTLTQAQVVYGQDLAAAGNTLQSAQTLAATAWQAEVKLAWIDFVADVDLAAASWAYAEASEWKEHAEWMAESRHTAVAD